ncbi:MAG: hypothetical protein ABFR65_10600 [Pseudomonadota bacterium]
MEIAKNLAILLGGLWLMAAAYPLNAENAFYDWQHQQLLHPTSATTGR